MSKVIPQPCANKGSREHYDNTIRNPVKLDAVRQFLDNKDIVMLKNIYTSGQLRVWRFTPGAKEVNVSKWNRLEVRDINLMSAYGKFLRVLLLHTN